MATPFTQQQLQTAGANPNMYKAPTFAPPSPQYSIPGTNDYTTNPEQAIKNASQGNMTAVPGVGVQPMGTYGTNPAVQQSSTTPQIGSPSLQNQQQDNTLVPTPIENIEAPSITPTGQKYQQAFNTLQQGGSKAPVSSGQARVAVSQATPLPQTQPYQPSPQFMTVGDPIMQQFMQVALQTSNEVTDTGYTAKSIQRQFGAQLQNLDLQALNMQNIINGTRDDIRAEISKAGGFATESQIEALTTTRNRDLLKNYNNLELQKQALTTQMNTQVGLASLDHQFAVDKYNNVMKAGEMYRNIYNNTTTQIDQLINRVGYSGLAQAYNNDPYTLSLAEQHLGMPSGTLTNPSSLDALETYREKTLNLSNARFGAQYGYSPNQPTPDTSNNFPGGGPNPTSNPNVPYEQYGLLSHTNFDPKNTGDKNALNYLNTYLNGTMPQNAGDIGISIRGAVGQGQYQSAITRANDLYFAATGQNLPSPEIVKSNLKLISANNQLANTLKVQEQTVDANFGLSLQNLNSNNLNSAWPVLNGVINSIKNAEGDPAVAQYLAQNSTIQQELGNLLAVKNASGTTVHDKIAGAGLMPPNATPQQQITVVKALLQEAQNASKVFNRVNGELYSQTDPLQRQTNNPMRQNTINAQVPSDWVTMTGPKGAFKVDPKNVDTMKQNGYK